MAGVPVSEKEYAVLKRMAERGFREGTLDEAARVLGLDKSTLASIAMLLKEKGLVDVRQEVERRLVLTDRGREALERGPVELRLVRLLVERGGEAPLSEVVEALGGEANVALGIARRKGLVEVGGGRVRLAVPPEEALRRASEVLEALRAVAEGREPPRELLEELRRRRLVGEEERERVYIRLLGDPGSVLGMVAPEASALTVELLRDGRWRRVRFREYDVTAEPPRVLPARLHYLTAFIEELRDIMREMGFREVTGPLVELELFNFDMLFQAQDHPAREVHDTLRPALKRLPVPGEQEDTLERLKERVAAVHRRGWGYRWDERVALRPVLRSQTTSVSARVLAGLAGLEPSKPLRVFTIGRVFRRDPADPTHLPEFHQLDGIEGWDGYTFRDLLGTLREIAERLGLQIRFKPAYFPFTEPSVEGYVRLPDGRWLELFGAGLFRPEVLEMAGVDFTVGAWGMGIERLAAARYGIKDIRLLYTSRVEDVMSFPESL